MKKVIPLAMLVAGAVLFVASYGSSKSDTDTIDSVVGSMAAADLNPINSGGGGSTVPELKPEDVLVIIDHLREVEKHNGYLGIARKLGHSTWQVKEVAWSMEKRLAELASIE